MDAARKITPGRKSKSKHDTLHVRALTLDESYNSSRVTGALGAWRPRADGAARKCHAEILRLLMTRTTPPARPFNYTIHGLADRKRLFAPHTAPAQRVDTHFAGEAAHRTFVARLACITSGCC